MKLFNKLLLLTFTSLLAWSCMKEQDMAILNSGAIPQVTLSTNELVLNKESAQEEALAIAWQTDYGFSASSANTILIDKKGGDFTKAASVTTGAVQEKKFKTAELNSLLIGLGLAPNEAADVDIRIQSKLGTSTLLTSEVLGLKVTPYSVQLDLSSPWGIVGSAINDWGATPDAPLYKTDTPNELVAYVTFIDGEIKFRQDNDWTVNLGGKDGKLSDGGDNIVVKAGTYKVTFNAVALTYKIEKYAWGLVGSAANDWGATPDLPLSYDPTVDLWRAVVKLVDGELKFRQNNDWGVNYGGANGVLVDNGDNIVVTKGTYLVTANFKELKYTITPYIPWGIVGDATATGWGDQPDQKFSYDLSTETWHLNNVVLTDGAMKFRLNDDWGVNLGSTAETEPDPIAESGPLKSGGKNFAVTAGVWSFVLDVKDLDNPSYTAKKIK
ncbi:SusE-like outer membrane protein [Dyadobacter jejuensis]|uniref:SusE-like outer membrane protein n=2 Tax=Dyadobacter jejuensis TaxID=1082580 RepID=A0A316AH51_9BACT|nr:SusE-like outer membrane protein [Dyadobacter jejuensis]